MPSECTPRFLASDNTSGICPEAMQYLLEANQADDLAYGNDRWTARAAARARRLPSRARATLSDAAVRSAVCGLRRRRVWIG